MTQNPDAATKSSDLLRLFRLVVVVTTVAFALFGVAASLVVAGLFYKTGPRPEIALIPRFLVKAGLFAVIASGAFFVAYRLRGPFPTATAPAKSLKTSRLVIALFIASPILLAVFPRLGTYPWAAPDEMHHLVVARNLATLGAYASGHPDDALRPFDTYDSVGPPVILPVGLALRFFGVDVAVARGVMAAYFVLLCLALIVLFKPYLEPYSLGLSILFMTASFGSVYLGRTLYGEVPGLFFLVLGLIAWRRALQAGSGLNWGAAAGAAFGLAVLCKSILILSAFAFVAALLYDMLTFRRIRPRHVLSPAAGLALVVGAWWAVQTMSRYDVASAAGGTLGIYQHNLMFGLRSAPAALAKCLSDPFSTISLILAMVVVMNNVFRRHYDPALAALWFLGVFYAWWWVFFTPGQKGRYLWFSAAIAAAFVPWFFNELDGIMRARRSRGGAFGRVSTLLILAAVAAISVASALNFSRELRLAWTVDEMSDDYALANWAVTIPDDARFAATWPVSGSLAFLANKPVSVLEKIPDPIPAGQVCIIDTITRPKMLGGRQPDLRFGRYVVLKAKE